MTRRRGAAAAGAALLVAGGATAVVLAGGGDDEARAGDASTGTKLATITRRDLVETDAEDGTLGFSDARTVVNRRAGTVTWLPRVGAVVRPGHRLYAVDGSPVYLMDGAAPAFRALTPSTPDGADVRQLERGLRRLGCDPSGAMTVDGSWDAGTTAAVKRWQDARGLEQTGSIELGRIVFQPGARRVASIDVTLGGSAASGGGQAATSGGGVAGVVGGLASGLLHAMQVGVTPTTTTTTTTTPVPAPTVTQTVTVTTPAPRAPATTTRSRPTPTAAAGPTAPVRSAGGGGGARAAASGGSASAGGSGAAGSASGSTASSPLLTTTSTRQVVAVPLDATKQAVARRGARVSVELPAGDVVPGRIARVGTVATAADGQAGEAASAPTIKVTVKLTRRVTALDQAPVTVNFEQSRARDVLTIPVTALLARPGGRFGVEVREGGARRVVAVTTGLFASGYVEIEGAVRPGQRVTDSGI